MNDKVITLRELLETEDSEKYIKSVSFEAALKLLEELVGMVEAGSLPLDKAVGSYEKGVKLVKHLRAQLSDAEEKLKSLQKD